MSRATRSTPTTPCSTRLDPAARATVIADFRPIPGSPLGEIAARWDVVLGQTALEGDDGIMRGAIGKPEGAPAFWDYVKDVGGEAEETLSNAERQNSADVANAEGQSWRRNSERAAILKLPAFSEPAPIPTA